MVVAIFPLLFVSDNEDVLYKIMTTAESLFSHMTDGAGCTTITEGHSPACCSACAPVLGFQQPVAAPTHVATGAASEGRNSINKTRPLDNIHRVRAAAPRERVNHLFRPSPPPSSPSHPPHLHPCHMSATAANVRYIGLSFISFKTASPSLRNEAVTQLVLVSPSPVPALKLACICPRAHPPLWGRGSIAAEPLSLFR